MTDESKFRTGGGASLFDELGIRNEQLIGRKIGGYEITAFIGEGGMGQVFKARRAEPDFDRVVAIKLVASRLNETLRQRFLLERQILAELNHPGIAQLYDAGITEEGWPYLVMEYVAGVSVDQYCRDNALDIAQRVDLLAKVAAAVSHAHTRLIVHRDLKPGNVLVGADGLPKLLDFGIAKLVESGGHETTHLRPLTPGFASPEQLLGQPVTVASDVYQMGLLAYSVLADDASLLDDQTVAEAIERAGQGNDLKMPDKVRTALPLELVFVIEHCLRAAPDDRYHDVNEFRDDLLRYQQSYPVRAAPPGAWYRLRKLMARNRPATVIATIAAVSIVTATTWYTLSLKQSRELAESRAETTSRVLQAMTRMVGDTYAGIIRSRGPGKAAAESDPDFFLYNILLETESIVARELASESGARTELMRVQGKIQLVLGNIDVAEETLREAQGVARIGGNREAELQVVLDLVNIAAARTDIETARQTLARATEIAADLDLSTTQRVVLLERTGEVQRLEGAFDKAIATLTEAATQLEALENRDPVALAHAYSSVATTYNAKREPEAALEWANKAINLLEAEFEPGHFRLIAPYRSAGMAYQDLEEFERSHEFHMKALESARAHYGEIHPQVGDAYNSLGALAYRENRRRDAIDYFEKSLHVTAGIFGEQHVNVAGQYSNIGVLQMDTGDIPGAEISIDRSMAIIDTLGDSGKYPRSIVLRNVARLQLLKGELDLALRTSQEAVALRGELFGADNSRTQDARVTLLETHVKLGNIDDARAEYDLLIQQVIDAVGPDDPVLDSWEASGWVLLEAEGKWKEARTALQNDLQISLDIFGGPEYLVVAEKHIYLAEICLRIGDLVCAEESLRDSLPGLTEATTHPLAYHRAILEAEWLERTGRESEGRQKAQDSLDMVRSLYPARTDLIKKAISAMANK